MPLEFNISHITLIRDRRTKVQPNSEKTGHRLVNKLITELKRLSIML